MRAASALLAHPPMNIINYGILLGIPVPLMMQTAAVLARIKALAVDPAWRGQGIGGAPIDHCLALYVQLGYLILYGQISIAEQLEDYYDRFGFDVLDPGDGISLAGLVGAPYNISPGPGERLIIQRLASPADLPPIVPAGNRRRSAERREWRRNGGQPGRAWTGLTELGSRSYPAVR